MNDRLVDDPRWIVGYDDGVADERARCIKVLEDLRATKDYSLTGRILTLDDAIAALSPPVASSPVGGEQ